MCSWWWLNREVEDLRGILHDPRWWSSSGTSHEEPSTAAQCRIVDGHGPIKRQPRILVHYVADLLPRWFGRCSGSVHPSCQRAVPSSHARAPVSSLEGRPGCRWCRCVQVVLQSSAAVPCLFQLQDRLQGPCPAG